MSINSYHIWLQQYSHELSIAFPRVWWLFYHVHDLVHKLYAVTLWFHSVPPLSGQIHYLYIPCIMLWPCKFLAVTLWCTTFEWSEICHRFYIPPPLNMSPFKCTYVMYHPHDIYGLFYLILILGLASNALQWCSTFEWSETFWALWQLLMHCLFMKWPFDPWSLMNFGFVLPYSYSGPGIHWCTTLEWSETHWTQVTSVSIHT